MTSQFFGPNTRPPDKPPTLHSSYAKATKGNKETFKQFAEIVERSRKERNKIEIRFTKIKDLQTSEKPSRYIDMETISDYIFTELGINPDDVLEIDLNTGRYDCKQILLKPNIDTSRLTSEFPDTFNGYSINVTKLTETTTRIKFNNVPLEVPDEEILNLCSCYGKVEGKVGREQVQMNNAILGKIKVTSATRFVYMKLDPGKKFNNFYWMEGPLPGDQGRRITVTHYNQLQQCSYCLRTADSGCLGFGHGRKCEENGGYRAKMSEYMLSLKKEIGYISLKEQYNLEMAKIFDKLESDGMTAPDDMDKYVVENWEDIITEEEKVAEVNTNDVNEKDKATTIKETGETNSKVPNPTKETDNSTAKIKNSKALVEKQLISFIENKVIDKEMIDTTTKIYSSLFTEEYFVMDEAGALKVSQGTFLNKLDLERDDMDNNPTVKIIIERMAEHFSSTVVKKARRLSISVKRRAQEELVTDKLKENQRQRKA